MEIRGIRYCDILAKIQTIIAQPLQWAANTAVEGTQSSYFTTDSELIAMPQLLSELSKVKSNVDA